MKIFQRDIHVKSDSELLNHYLQSGDLEVLGELYNRYIHLVYGVCLKYLNDREESKDTVSKIFENLISEVPKFEIQNFRSWLYVVTKNYCLMEIRKKKTQNRRFEKYSHDIFMESTDISHPVDEVSDSNSLHSTLKVCIERLKEEQRTCIQAFYFKEKCYQEISDELNIDLNKVKSYIQNGKRNLKICLEQNNEKQNV